MFYINMDSKEALIEKLIQGGYLKTPEIIEAFRAIDRADFVRPGYLQEAYGNYPLPIGEGQTISQPLTVAFLLELLEPQKGEKILDIGSGSGWTTALLAHIVSEQGGKVFGVERIPGLCKFGAENIEKYNFLEKKIVELFCGDGAKGLPEHAPFDKILAGAAAPDEIPPAWRAQLKIGGRIVVPVRDAVHLAVKKSETEWEEKQFSGFSFVPLVEDSESGIMNYESSKEERKIKKWTKLFLSLCFLLFVSAAVLANEIYVPHTAYKGTGKIEIAPRIGSRKIGELLKKEGIIRSKWAFVVYVSASGNASRLKPGKYVFGKAAIPAITRDLVRGISERTITIPEGWTLREIDLYLAVEEIGSSDSFALLVSAKGSQVFSERFEFLAERPKNTGLEGYLFPDTYRVFQDTSRETIIAKMLENFDKKVTRDLRQEVQRQRKILFDALTMASLIEKEVVFENDRAIVSGILWKRLELGIPLQVDATIVYVKRQTTKDESQKIKSKISLDDTKIDSPYNTYLYRGLPPGPIANPGISAIQAAIYPKSSLYLYYLSSPDGRTIFSKTLDEHNEAKTKYLRN